LAIPKGIDPKKLLEEIRQAKAKLRFLDFVRFTFLDYKVDPVHAYVAGKLQAFVEAAERGESPRLILKMPPQHGKSTLSSRYLPAWILGRNPKWHLALMSYSADWANSLSRNARDIVESDEFNLLWPEIKVDPSARAVDDWALTRKSGGGSMRAVGRDGGITGRPAHILIVDDPIKNREEAYSDTTRKKIKQDFGPNFRTRIQEGGGILVVATQWHHDELLAHLQKQNDPDADKYEVVNLPAFAEADDPLGRAVGEPLAVSRYGVQSLKAIKASLDSPLDWDALYQGRPTPEGGNIFKTAWFEDNQEDDPHNPGWVFQAADTAYSEKTTADYTVVTTWRVERNCYRLLGLHRERMEFPSLKERIPELAQAHDPVAVLVEDKASGISLIQELRQNTRLPIIAWRPDRDKTSRAIAITNMLKSGLVKFPNDAPWWKDFLAELAQFPAGAHDDQVDAMTMALTWAREQEPKLADQQVEYSDFTYDSDNGQSDERANDFWSRVSEFRKAA
jgi:predicted phage terminase large subunit-like protein